MRDFGEILAENRKKKGYSQSDLVNLLSQEGIQVTTKAISKWETNAREPALHVFLTLCQLLDIEDTFSGQPPESRGYSKHTPERFLCHRAAF